MLLCFSIMFSFGFTYICLFIIQKNHHPGFHTSYAFLLLFNSYNGALKMSFWKGLIIFVLGRKKKIIYIFIYGNTVYFIEINLAKFQVNRIWICIVSFIRWVCNSCAHRVCINSSYFPRVCKQYQKRLKLAYFI